MRTDANVSETMAHESTEGVPHPFASDLQALDCKLRNETDEEERAEIMADMAFLRNGVSGPNSKRYFGRHMKVRAKTYKAPAASWFAKARAAVLGE